MMLPNKTQFATADGPKQFSKPHIYEVAVSCLVLMVGLEDCCMPITMSASVPG